MGRCSFCRLPGIWPPRATGQEAEPTVAWRELFWGRESGRCIIKPTKHYYALTTKIRVHEPASRHSLRESWRSLANPMKLKFSSGSGVDTWYMCIPYFVPSLELVSTSSPNSAREAVFRKL